MLDFRVATFLNVCETLNYTRTAEALSISQPAVSQHIAQLEQRLGAKLFERQGKRLVITDAGRVVRSVAETMAHDDLLLREELRALSRASALLSVGVTLTAGEYLLAKPLARYLATRPHAQARIVQGDTQELIAQLRAGTLDCALIEGAFDRTAFDARTFCRERLVGICAPASDRAGLGGAVALEELTGERLIVRERGSGTRAVLERALFDHNLTIGSFAHVIEVSSINIIKTLVAEGAGIAFLYEAAVADDISSGRLARIRLNSTAIEHDIAFVHLKNSAFADRLMRFYDDIAALRDRASAGC